MFNIKILIFFACIFESWARLAFTNESFFKIGANRYYVAPNEKETWYDAVKICRDAGADIVHIESQEELDALSAYFISHGYKDSERFTTAFNSLGLYGTFMSLHTGKPMTFANWAPGQPDNRGGVEHCVQLWKQWGKYRMNDADCMKPYNYICQLFDFYQYLHPPSERDFSYTSSEYYY